MIRINQDHTHSFVIGTDVPARLDNNFVGSIGTESEFLQSLGRERNQNKKAIGLEADWA